ncbi:hypothetical protein AOG25_14200 [Vibrio alginolyticus]|nr:hypothetical protein AOG25_14200 [Vibrio alginolyticus]
MLSKAESQKPLASNGCPDKLESNFNALIDRDIAEDTKIPQRGLRQIRKVRLMNRKRLSSAMSIIR